MKLFILQLGLCTVMAATLPYHILACWHKTKPKSLDIAYRLLELYYDKKLLEMLKPIAPIFLHPQLDSWNKKRRVWSQLRLTSPLCSIHWTEHASIPRMLQTHANAVIELIRAFVEGKHILNLWAAIQLAVKELYDALIILKYKFEELDDSIYVNLLIKVQEEYEQRFNALEQDFFGHGPPQRNQVYSQYLKILMDQRTKVDGHFKEKAVLFLAQNYNLMSKLEPHKQYSPAHLDAFNRACAEVLYGLPAQTPYGRALRVVMREKMTALRMKWLKVFDGDSPTWSTWYGVPVPMQFSLRSISEHNPALGGIVERHWSMFIRGLFLDRLTSNDGSDPFAAEIYNHFLDLKEYLSLHADFREIEKHVVKMHNQFSLLFLDLSERPMRGAMVSFMGFKRMGDYRTTEEWVRLLREYWPISKLKVGIQENVLKLLHEINL